MNFTVARTHLQRFKVLIMLLFFIILLSLILSRFFSHHITPKSQPVSVVLAPVLKRDVPIYLSALGTVTPVSTITIRTQINGQLLRVLFREGQIVKAGEVLAEIDPRPFQAQLIQYEGQLLRDQALYANALIDLKRYQKLWRQDAIAEQVLATQKSLTQQYQGAIKTDQGLIQAVQVNLAYCKIKAPISGRIGLRLVDPGNYVQVSDSNGLVVITMLTPMTVIFTLPEDDLEMVSQQMTTRVPLVVNAYDREQTVLLAKGVLLTMDNQIDPATGTVKLRAIFNNKEYKLFPNQFVNVKLLVKTLHAALIIPTAGIQYNRQGAFVYLFTDKQKVKVQTINIITTINNESVITGLVFGQRIVVEGADKLTEGTLVKEAKTSHAA